MVKFGDGLCGWGGSRDFDKTIFAVIFNHLMLLNDVGSGWVEMAAITLRN